MASCVVCREDIKRGTQCPRCGSDNRGMTDLTLGYFLSIWAILSFLLIFVPVFMLLPKILSTLHNILWPIASVRVAAPIALLITLIIAFFMFTMRDDLHDYSQSITFKEKKGIPTAFERF